MPPTIKQLKEKRLALIERAKAIKAGADAAGRELTEEETTLVTQQLDEADKVKGDIDSVEKRAALDDRLKGAGEEISSSVGVAVQPNQVGDAITHVHEKWKDDPKKGFKTPRQFMMEVINAGLGYTKISPQLKHMYQANSGGDPSIMAAAGSDEHSTFADSRGGFLVPEGFSPRLLRIEPEADPIGGRTTNIPMTTTKLDIPARVDKNHTSSVSGGLQVFRRAEAATIQSTRMQFEQVSLNVHSLFGLSYATEEILSDSPISFAALISSGFGDEFISRMIDERLNGTGVGEFLGINNSPAMLTISKETGQAAKTIVYENIIKMRAQSWRYGDAMWLANHDILPQLMLLNQSVGTAGMGMIWQPSAREDHPDMLLGRPLIFSEYPETLGTAGDLQLTTWSQYLEATFQPMQSAESIHVRFVSHERAFKMWLRNAAVPWWNAALTPKKSSDKLSPFIRLATRA